ncbi:MAG: hypothetical protein JO141_32465 [Bradyrhizobium sp.]|nr:hypothetical protein [Bradyrhizobium sp.]
MAELRHSSRELNPYLVLIRFCVRITILITFAAFSSAGFGMSLAALLAMAALLCTIVATVRREAMFSRALNHWDEAVVYAALYFLCVGLNLSLPL